MKSFHSLPRQTRQLFLALSLAVLAQSLLYIRNTTLFAPSTERDSNTLTLTEQNKKIAQVQTTDATPQVLGNSTQQTPSIYIQGGENSFSSGGLIAMSTQSDPVVEVSGYNLSDKFKVTLYQANESAMLKYLEYDSEYKQKNKDVDSNGMAQLTSFERDLNSSAPLRLELPIQNAGIYYLKLQSSSLTVHSFIIRSNFGAVAKEGDNEALIWTQDFDTLRRLPGVSYTAYSLSNGLQQLSTGTTDDQGITKIGVSNRPDLAILKKDDRIALLPLNLQYLSSWGGSSYNNFDTYKQQTRFFTFTDRPLYRPDDKLYFKSILRNEDDARFTIPSGSAKVTLGKGWNDEDGVIFSKQFPISENGAVDGEISIPEDVSTGSYILRVQLSEQLSSYQEVAIEYFRKPEYTVEIETNQRQLISQDDVSFTVNGSFFSGQPLANKEVSYKVYSGDYYSYEYYYPNQQVSENYRYGSYWGGNGSNEPINQGTVTLDAKGKGQVQFKSSIPRIGNSQVYSVEISYEDDTGNPSFDRKNILVFDGEYSIYRSPDTPYSSRINEKAQLDLKLQANNNASVASVPLTATVTRSFWVPVQDATQKYQQYREEKETLPSLTAKSDAQGKAHFEFVPQKQGSYQLTVEGKDKRGNVIHRNFYLYVVDEGGVLYGQNSSAEGLSLSTDKGEYLPNGTVNATIISKFPYRDVLLTFERARLNRFQVVQLNSATTKIALPLQNTDLPNIFLRATSYASNGFEDTNTQINLNTDTKKLKVALTPDRTDYGPGDQVTVNVQTTDTAGNPLSAEVAVWSVDKAIFELKDSQSSDIFNAFWQERYLNTSTTHSLQGISVNMAEGGGCFVGGTMITLSNGTQKPIEEIKIGEMILTRSSSENNKLVQVEVKNTRQAKDLGYFIINGSLKVTSDHFIWINDSWQTVDQLQIGDQIWSQDTGSVTVSSLEWITQATTVYNLETSGNHTFLANGYWVHNQKGGGGRTVFKDTAYWNPRVQTDSNGRAQVVFKLPDNLTTWVVAGIGATRDTIVGEAKQEIKVSKDVVIRPVLPNILQQDDPILIESIVQNFTDKSQDFTVSLTFDSGEIWPAETQSITIPANDSANVKWQVVPRKENEAAKFTFSAKTNQADLSDVVEQRIAVQPFGFLQESAQSANDSATFPIVLPTKFHPDKSSVTINLASSIITSLPAAISYLIDYPYGCVEQTTSRFVPTIIAASNTALFKDVLEDKNLPKIVTTGVNRLRTLQQNDGGWSWWGSQSSDDFITAYVTEYLIKAQEAGFDVDSEVLGRARNYFEYTEGRSNTDIISRRYALALLGSNKKLPITEFASLSPDQMAMAVMTNVRLGNMNPSTNGLSQLSAMAKTQGKEVYWEKGIYNRFGSREASTALASRAIMMAKGDQQMVVGAMQYLINNRRSYYWGNTFATAQTIQAVSDYSKISNELNPKYTYQVSIDGVNLANGSVKDTKSTIKPINVPLTSIKADGSSVIEIKKTGEGQLYSSLVNKSFVTDKQSPAISHGVTITRRYLSENDEEVIPAVGDYVNVELTIDGLQEEASYGVIQDFLPAGMIPVNKTFNNQQAQDDSNTKPYWRYSEGLSNVEYTENGAILSLYKVLAKSQTYSYKARVISQGEFTPPPAKFALMYNPDVYAQSEIKHIKIGDESIIIPGKDKPVTIAGKKSQLDLESKIIIAAIAMLVSFGTIFLIERKKIERMILHAPETPKTDEK